MNLAGLKVGLTLYGSWASLARAGFQNEILKEYANYRIQLTKNDIQELKRIFLCSTWDYGWEKLLTNYKEKNETTVGCDSQNNNALNNVVPPIVRSLPGDLSS